MSLDDAWDSPYVRPPSPKRPSIVAARVSSNSEKTTEETQLEEIKQMRAELAKLTLSIAETREERTRQAHAILVVLGVQAFFLFTYLDKLLRGMLIILLATDTFTALCFTKHIA